MTEIVTNRTCDMCDRLFNENYMSWIEFLNDSGYPKRYILCNNCVEKLNKTGEAFFKQLELLEAKKKDECWKIIKDIPKDLIFRLYCGFFGILAIWYIIEMCF